MKRSAYKQLLVLLCYVCIPLISRAQKNNASALDSISRVMEERISVQLEQALQILDTLKIPELPDLPPIPEIPPIPAFPEIAAITQHAVAAAVPAAYEGAMQAIKAAIQKQYDFEKSKKINKEYTVTEAEKLEINNKYGKVHVNTWEKNIIKVDIEIIARSNSEARAEEVLKNIDVVIVDDKSTHLLQFKTQFNNQNWGGSNKRTEYEINYTVSMPGNNALAVNNSFGDCFVGDHDGAVSIKEEYGSLKTGRLQNKATNIAVAFGSMESSYLKEAALKVSYSECEVDEAGVLTGKIAYSNFKLKKLNESLTLKSEYSPVDIDQINKDFKAIDLKSRFGEVELQFDPSAAFAFDVDLAYSDLNANKKLMQFTASKDDDDDDDYGLKKHYKGNYGKNTARSNVQVVSEYGNVRFGFNN